MLIGQRTAVLGSNSAEVPVNWKDYLTEGELFDLTSDQGLGDAETPCRACGGRGYDRRDPDQPCGNCHGEGVEL
jgi:DnaJ-class molecular chaperone